MTWQDELRRLDEELASGRISADDYRTRRDRIMATAVSAGTEQAPVASESTTIMSPVKSNQGDDADSTQIVPGQNVDQDRTQAVGGWRATPPEDPNRTQVVPGVPQQPFVGGGPRPAPPPGGQNVPPWQNEEPMAAPWAGQDFPPLVAANTPDWALQGPEVFETEKKGGAGKALGIVAIVVVLIGLAAGAYFLFRPDENPNPGGGGGNDTSTNQSQPPTTEEKPKGPIAELPGEQVNMEQVKTFEQVEKIDYLTPQEITLYKKGGASDSAVAISTDQDVRIIVLVTTMSSPEDAIEARDALAQLQLKFKLKEQQSEPGVLAASNPDASSGPLQRAHYASGDKVVRIQTQGKDGEVANQLFAQVIADQLERLPADA